MAADLEAEYRRDLRRVVLEQVGEGYEELCDDTPLLEYGILDSLMIQTLLAFIEDRYHVILPPEEVRPEKFNSIRDMARVICECAQNEFSGGESQPFEVLNVMMEAYGLRRRRVELPQGRVHLLECAGQKPTLVLLSGLGSPASSWGVMMRSLRGRRHALAPDLLGFGVSGEPRDGSYSFQGHVDSMLALLEELCPEPVVLVGNSAGAMIAAEIARTRPERVQALVVLSFGRVRQARLWWQTLEELSRDASAFWKRAFRDPPPLSSGLRRQIQRTLSSRAYQEFLDEPALERMDGLFEGLALPVLFVGGMDDGVVDLSIVEDGARQVPGARFEKIPRCGHFAQSERSEEVLVILEHFLRNQVGVR